MEFFMMGAATTEKEMPKAEKAEGTPLSRGRELARDQVRAIQTLVDDTRGKIDNNNYLTRGERDTFGNKLRTMSSECRKIEGSIVEGQPNA
jgi:hypothetical protein